MSHLRVFVAERDRDTRLGLQMLLEHQPKVQIVGISVQSKGLLGQVAAALPDVVILDWQLIASSPSEHIKNIRSIESQPEIIVLDVHTEIRDEAEAIGADYFFSKADPPDQLLITLDELKQERNQE